MGVGGGQRFIQAHIVVTCDVRQLNISVIFKIISWAGAMGVGGGQRFIQAHIVVTCEVRELNISVIFH